MPMVPKFALIDRKPDGSMVMFCDFCRHFRLLARSIANLMGVTNPTPFWLEPSKPVNIKMPTHAVIISWYNKTKESYVKAKSILF